MSDRDLSFLGRLEEVIGERIANPTPESYTAALIGAGTRRIAQKLGEEAVELALAATAGNREEQIDEAADLVFHLLVLLASQGLSLTQVVARLESRHEE